MIAPKNRKFLKEFYKVTYKNFSFLEMPINNFSAIGSCIKGFFLRK
ncbi:MAG TPA: hypothetical protein DHV15_07510 [Treponema sp.]|uniref:Lipoprotein n=1 Tax=Treponema denticola (strain ATCC 35405 / DSM 14222 / CIP 103919 / JCM 8153 / KCTC 15104) TaxID=243275 RepID=Q73K45_TREDE|nr:hypothetical protein TDE_2377 [Treponema denticola ATCC 35405]HCY95344.1 hypothetical protein [Treponema sp.]